MLIQSTFNTLQAALLGLLAAFAAPQDEDAPALADDPTSAEAEPLDPLALVDTPDVTAADVHDVYIEDIAAYGPGCPRGTVAAMFASNRRSFLVSYSRMALDHPNSAGKTVHATNCVLTLKLHVPDGVQVSLATVVARGYAFLDHGIRARQSSKYSFAGTSIRVRRDLPDLPGGFDGYYDFADRLEFWTRGRWSSCGGSVLFVIDSRLQLDATANPAGDAFFNTIGTDGKLDTRYHVRWRRC